MTRKIAAPKRAKIDPNHMKMDRAKKIIIDALHEAGVSSAGIVISTDTPAGTMSVGLIHGNPYTVQGMMGFFDGFFNRQCAEATK